MRFIFGVDCMTALLALTTQVPSIETEPSMPIGDTFFSPTFDPLLIQKFLSGLVR